MADALYLDLKSGKLVPKPTGAPNPQSVITIKSGTVRIISTSPNLKVVK